MEIQDHHDVNSALAEMRQFVTAALAATNTRDMSTLATSAQATGVRLRLYLDDLLDNEDAILDQHLDRYQLEAARNALGIAIVRGEAVALGTDLPSMRERVLDLQASVEEAVPLIRLPFGLAES